MHWWKITWIIVLIFSFAAFWGIAIVVAVRGVADIKFLFKHMLESHKQDV